MTSPVYNVKAIPLVQIRANNYNPNAVAPPEMRLLEKSIREDGYTMPIVCYYLPDEDIYEIVDGFHRYTVMMTCKDIRERENSMMPVVTIEKDISNRMASTIRHNRARGSHNVELMSTIVSELVEMGKGDAWICKHVGMSMDEVLRMKQITGLASLFLNKDFSDSWEVGNVL
jgi:ParB-like chromosome segregation protein Spo0J